MSNTENERPETEGAETGTRSGDAGTKGTGSAGAQGEDRPESSPRIGDAGTKGTGSAG